MVTPSPRPRGEGRGEGAARGKERRPRQPAGEVRCAGRTDDPPRSLLWATLAEPPVSSTASNSYGQEPIGPYFADFVCRDRRLIIELDGGQHADSLGDRRRDQELAALGYRVVRVWNTDVIENIDGALRSVLGEAAGNSPSPRPSPRKRSEGAYPGNRPRRASAINSCLYYDSPLQLQRVCSGTLFRVVSLISNHIFRFCRPFFELHYCQAPVEVAGLDRPDKGRDHPGDGLSPRRG